MSFRDEQGTWQAGCQRALEDLVDSGRIEPSGAERMSTAGSDPEREVPSIFDALPGGHLAPGLRCARRG